MEESFCSSESTLFSFSDSTCDFQAKEGKVTTVMTQLQQPFVPKDDDEVRVEMPI